MGPGSHFLAIIDGHPNALHICSEYGHPMHCTCENGMNLASGCSSLICNCNFNFDLLIVSIMIVYNKSEEQTKK